MNVTGQSLQKRHTYSCHWIKLINVVLWPTSSTFILLLFLREIKKLIKSHRIKGIVHPKITIGSSFTHPQVVPNLYECLCSAEHKGRYSKECGKQSRSGAPLTSIVFYFLLWKSMVPQNSLIMNILQNIFLYVQQNTDIHTGLELLEGE